MRYCSLSMHVEPNVSGSLMAGDWIKMRVALLTHPKVMKIASMMERDKEISKALAKGFGGELRSYVTRNVTRDVTIAALLRVWGATNEHTADGTWKNTTLDDLDHVAEIPGFGRMLEAVEWAIVDTDAETVTFPNFLEYNAPAKEGRGLTGAERQRRYRERKKARELAEIERVTALRNGGAEKRREEKRVTPPPPQREEIKNHEAVDDSWRADWCRWVDTWDSRCSKRFDPILAETQLMQLARLPPSKAALDLRFSLEKQAASICDSENDFSRRTNGRRGSHAGEIF